MKKLGTVRIPTPIFDAFIQLHLTGREWSILHFIIRKTYGFNKPRDRISANQFAHATGISRRHVIEAVQSLIERQIITTDSAEISTRAVRAYALNERFEQWCLESETADSIVPKSALQVLKQLSTTKEKRNPKEKDSKPSLHFEKQPTQEKEPDQEPDLVRSYIPRANHETLGNLHKRMMAAAAGTCKTCSFNGGYAQGGHCTSQVVWDRDRWKAISTGLPAVCLAVITGTGGEV